MLGSSILHKTSQYVRLLCAKSEAFVAFGGVQSDSPHSSTCSSPEPFLPPARCLSLGLHQTETAHSHWLQKETEMLSESLQVCFLAYMHMWILGHHRAIIVSSTCAGCEICALATLSMLIRSVGLQVICSNLIRLHISKCDHLSL